MYPPNILFKLSLIWWNTYSEKAASKALDIVRENWAILSKAACGITRSRSRRQGPHPVSLTT